MRLGRNHGGYFGDPIDIDLVLRDCSAAARRQGWTLETLRCDSGLELLALSRPPRARLDWAPRIYFSAGIHGDEPAAPLAVQRLLEQDAFPPNAWLWCCPCLNPTGFPANSRASAEGIDLNRDYRDLRSPETRAHVAWLQRQPMFDLSICLHEDWEAAGFYIYELNPAQQPSLAPAILERVRAVCPIDMSPLIDGREACNGLICPTLDPTTRLEWPEAFYLIQNKTRFSYTLEAPSDYPLATRVAALELAVQAAVETFVARPSLATSAPPDTASAPPP